VTLKPRSGMNLSVASIIIFTTICKCSGSLLSRSSYHDPGELTLEQRNIFCALKHAAGNRFVLHPAVSGARTCAVISHSGALLKHAHGRDIDKHTHIIRFNDNPTAGYEKAVGSRTSLRLGHGITWIKPGRNPSTPGDAVVITPGQNYSLWAQKFPKARIHMTRGYWSDSGDALSKLMSTLYPTRAGMRKTPSKEFTTGFDGMLIALSNCDFIDAYEMTPSDIASQCPYGYDTPPAPPSKKATDNRWHGFFVAEHDLWARLSVAGAEKLQKQGVTSYPGFASVQCPSATPAVHSVEGELRV